MARILSCVSSAKRGWSSAEKIDKSSRVNWMPNWRRTKFRSKKAIHHRCPHDRVATFCLPRGSETPPSGTTQNEATTSTAREKKRERERESDSKREKERCATDRPFVPFLFMQELMEIFLKRFLETTTKRSPSKISLSREKKDVHQPLKTTTEEEERTIERTMLATDVNGKAPFERLREFQRLAIARSLAYRGLYLNLAKR